MGITTFAAIHIGSYDVIMKIYEMSKTKGMKELNFIRHRLKIGQDSYNNRKISYDTMNDLCEKLNDFKNIMKEYDVAQYGIFATSAIREIANELLALEQIKRKTGMEVEVLSNSEQRFIEYMSVAAQEEAFNKIIKKKTAIADLGGGSLQISIFDRDRLISTQNIMLGTVWISEIAGEMDYRSTKYSEVIEELIQNDLECFESLYLNSHEIKNLIVVGELVARIVKTLENNSDNSMTKEQYMEFYNTYAQINPEIVVEKLGLSKDYSSMLKPTLILLKHLIKMTKAETIWAPGTNLTDGIAYRFALANNYIKSQHDFDEDIIAETENISKRYQCNKTHTAAIKSYADEIFDASKKLHKLSMREKLMLNIAAMLHDCGKYISMSNGAANAYNIVMSTEIIGLSHREREIVANVIYFNTTKMPEKNELLKRFDVEDYLIICKLTAILRIANVLDRSHKQKIKHLKAVLKDNNLYIYPDCSPTDFSLEKGMFAKKITLFEEVFGIEPVLKFKLN